jgi:DNA-binding NarL/FixJ family response regulator
VTDATPAGSTRIAIVDDHPVFRDGTVALLEREPDFEVVAVGASTDDAVAIADAPDAPDVLLLDVRLGDDSGLRVLESVARRTAVVILTAYDYPEYVRAALDAGAAGFVAKGAATAELVSTIRRAAAGALSFSSRPDEATMRLSAREVDVVRLVTDGLSNDEIGRRLGITTKAVEGHLGRVFARTGARSRTELAVRAVREGWADLPGT